MLKYFNTEDKLYRQVIIIILNGKLFHHFSLKKLHFAPLKLDIENDAIGKCIKGGICKLTN